MYRDAPERLAEPPLRRRPPARAARDRWGGPEGNQRLTALTGAMLLAGFAAEGLTLLSVRGLLYWHFFVGLALIGPLALKLGTTGYRFGQYYLGRPRYVRRGPPAPLPRLLGPFVIGTSVAVIGTGVALGLAGAPDYAGIPLLFLHKASFVLWFMVMTVHVLTYAWRLPRLIRADLPASRAGRAVGGGPLRWSLTAAAAGLGLIAAIAGSGLAGQWQRDAFGAPAAGMAPGLAGPAAVTGTAHGLPAAESGLLPWHLPAPLSREVAVTDARGRLVLLGGLTAAGASVADVRGIQPATGSARRLGELAAPGHDAAVAVLGGHALVFGGGSVSSVATVQSFTLSGGGGPLRAARAGALPAPRSDVAAVTIGRTAYVVGGYTGTRPAAAVLATTTGATFRTVAALPVPVRYPAVTALGGRILVFGGQAITGPKAGAPVGVIQAIDPARHTAAVIGHLPEPLDGAVAVTVGGEVFVAGGQSTTPQPRTRGAGTTQLGAAERATAATAASGGRPTHTVATIWAFDPARNRLLTAGRLQVPVSHAAVTVTGTTAWIAGGESGGATVSAVQMLRPNRAFGTAGARGAGTPYFGGRLLIADRGNNRLMVLDDTMHVVWKYPSAAAPRDPHRFYFPDDAFFADHGTAIISNQEQNDAIIKMAYPSGKIIWSYGHPGRPGTAPGYLHEPDDAFLLKNGQVTVADAVNCRVLVINPNRTVAHQIGTNGVCAHHPPASMGSPNGDTPLPNGDLLVSEINGSWVSEYTMTGRLAWTVHLPISYPSDPQQIGPDRYLIADYSSPGQILEFNRAGRILYRYAVAAGPGQLNHPSLTELLPSGVFMVNDDYHNRMAAIDPATRALVWQYGVTGQPGTGPGLLRVPDGFDLLLPNGSTPTHLATG